jgi:hypothetical protein
MRTSYLVEVETLSHAHRRRPGLPSTKAKSLTSRQPQCSQSASRGAGHQHRNSRWLVRAAESRHTSWMALKADASASLDSPDTSTVQGMLALLIRRGGPKVQAVYDGLIDMGYVPGVPDARPGEKRQPYLGWADPARHADGRARFAVYLDARFVSFRRVTDRRKVSGLPGADTSPAAYVAFRLAPPNSVAHALAAARAVKY